MITDAMSDAVQMRRWWSVFDGGDGLLPKWHTMLLSLVLQYPGFRRVPKGGTITKGGGGRMGGVRYAIDKQDAWQIAQRTRPVILRSDGKDLKKFKFKTQVGLGFRV